MPEQDNQQLVKIKWPMAGLNSRWSFQDQPPFTCPAAQNVRSDAHLLGRTRGGSRPGLGIAFRNELGSGNPIRMLSQVDIVDTSGLFRWWGDNFQGDGLANMWSAASWEDGEVTIDDGFATAGPSTDVLGEVLSTIISLSIDVTKTYEIGIRIVPHKGQLYSDYKIYAKADNTTPNVQSAGEGLVATLTLANGTFSGNLIAYASDAGTTYAFTGGDDSYAAAGWFVMRVDPGGIISCYWREHVLLSSQSAVGSPSGTRLGFGVGNVATTTGNLGKVDNFRIEYAHKSEGITTKRQLAVASANGELWIEEFLTNMKQVITDRTIASGRLVHAQQRDGKLYIADWEDTPFTGAAGVVYNGVLDQMTDSAVSDWTTHGLQAVGLDLAVVISNATGGISNGTYAIHSDWIDNPVATHIRIDSDFAVGDTGTCTWRIERAPKIFDPVANTFILWEATTGEVPVGCPVIARWRDRLFLAGALDNPHLGYFSKQGDPLDFNFTAPGTQRAIALHLGEAGQLGDGITAAIPHAADCMLIACRSSIWILKGDPAHGGLIDNISRLHGIVDKGAWTYVPKGIRDGGTICFLSLDGIYVMPHSCSTYPTSVSREVLPEELLHVNMALTDVNMAWDTRDRGVHIFLARKQGEPTSHFFFDWETRSFWPVVFGTTNHDPTSILVYVSDDPEQSAALAGCRDGRLRRFHKHHNVDDGNNAISSFVTIGPIPLTQNEYDDGMLLELIAKTALGGSINWEVLAGQSAEDAFNRASGPSGVWNKQGRNYSVQPRSRGGAFFLKLSGGDNLPWAVESITGLLRQLGKQRRA